MKNKHVYFSIYMDIPKELYLEIFNYLPRGEARKKWIITCKRFLNLYFEDKNNKKQKIIDAIKILVNNNVDNTLPKSYLIFLYYLKGGQDHSITCKEHGKDIYKSIQKFNKPITEEMIHSFEILFKLPKKIILYMGRTLYQLIQLKIKEKRYLSINNLFIYYGIIPRDFNNTEESYFEKFSELLYDGEYFNKYELLKFICMFSHHEFSLIGILV